MRIVNYNPRKIEKEIERNRRSVPKLLRRNIANIMKVMFVAALFTMIWFFVSELSNFGPVTIAIFKVASVATLFIGLVSFVAYVFIVDNPYPEDFREWFYKKNVGRNIVGVRRRDFEKVSCLEFSFENTDGTVETIVSPPILVSEHTNISDDILDLSRGRLKICFWQRHRSDLGKPIIEGDINENH